MTTFKMNEEWTEWTLADTGYWWSGQLCDTNRFEVPEVLTALLICK